MLYCRVCLKCLPNGLDHPKHAEEIIRLISDVNAERKKAFTFIASLNEHLCT